MCDGRIRSSFTNEQKNVVLKLISEDFSHDDIGKYVSVSRSCVSRFLKRFGERKTVDNLPKCGRPAKTTPRDDRCIIRCVKKDRRQTLRNLTNTVCKDLSLSIAARTIRRRLRSCGYRRRKIVKTLTISQVNRRRRLAWCKSKLTWHVSDKWKCVIFSDETQVVLDQNKNVYVWRKPDEIWKPECLGKLGGSTKLSVMFWGCITYHGVGTLVPVDGVIDSKKYTEILDANLWPVVAKNFSNKPWIFQDDNAPVHSSKFTQEWKIKNDISGMTWPAQSPDLNIIENVWRTIKLKLQSQRDSIKTRPDLITAVSDIWASLSRGYIRNLYESIPRRLHAVIIAKGYPTKY